MEETNMNECKHKVILCVYDSIGGYSAEIEGKEFKLIEYIRELDEESIQDRTMINYCPICGKKLGE